MARQVKQKPADLTISPKNGRTFLKDDDSPDTESSPMNLEGIDLSSSSFGADFGPSLTDLPALPLSPGPPPSPGLQRDPAKTFASNFNRRIPPEQEQRADPPRRKETKDDDEYRPGSSSMSKIYHLRKNPGSTPELSLVGSAENVGKHTSEVNNTPIPETRPPLSPYRSEDSVSVKRKDKGFRNPLSRSKSIRKDSSSKSKPSIKQPPSERPPNTAPLQSNWPSQSQENMGLFAKGTQRRGKSAERAVSNTSEENLNQENRPQTKDKDKDKGGFITRSKNAMSKDKDKSGGGNFFTRLGKIGRSGSSHEKEVPDSEYVLKVINLPLIEQTRKTRISKDLVQCRDKTEYWMPSLPWRCIDYLNLNCESEGLYRVPGSAPQVKQWQRRFDTELDVDLLDEQDLHDPNEIGSMLKTWLRELPSEIFPKDKQQALGEDLAQDNPDYQKMGEPVPQKLRDALSNLPPFNYYLLFAITCHLSLLLSHKDRNKMDLNNLSICIGPPLELDRWLFNYLVGDWRHCWQGCFTEKQYLEAEKAYEQGVEYHLPDPQLQNATRIGSETTLVAGDDRAVHSSDSNGSQNTSRQGSQSEVMKAAQKKSSVSRQNENAKPETYRPAGSPEPTNGSVTSFERKLITDTRRPSTAHAGEQAAADEGVDETGTPRPKPGRHSRSQSDLPLSPIKPVSPLDIKFQTRGQ